MTAVEQIRRVFKESKEAILMSTHNIWFYGGFYGELKKIIPKLSLNTRIICSTAMSDFLASEGSPFQNLLIGLQDLKFDLALVIS